VPKQIKILNNGTIDYIMFFGVREYYLIRASIKECVKTIEHITFTLFSGIKVLDAKSAIVVVKINLLYEMNVKQASSTRSTRCGHVIET
jgi:hypothetical protein